MAKQLGSGGREGGGVDGVWGEDVCWRHVQRTLSISGVWPVLGFWSEWDQFYSESLRRNQWGQYCSRGWKPSLNEEPQIWKDIRILSGLQKSVMHASFIWYDNPLSTHLQSRPKRCDYLYCIAPGLKTCSKLYRSWTRAGIGECNVGRQCSVF